jgi:hypothetical protein
VAAGLLKVFGILAEMVTVGSGRQGALWLLHFDFGAARVDLRDVAWRRGDPMLRRYGQWAYGT